MFKIHTLQGRFIVALLFLSILFSFQASFGQLAKTKTLRVLAIGNSFSEDALEHHLYGLSKAAGKQIIIGNLYIGGAPLSLHWKNIDSNLSAYEYRKITVDGKKTRTPNISIQNALADEDWDVISFQQASYLSGKFETIQAHLPQIYESVKSIQEAPAAYKHPRKVTYVYHQTWAYSPTSTHGGYVNYGNNQMQMYSAIAEATQKLPSIVPIKVIIPAGTAIQNARQTSFGTDLTRDGYHLEHESGKYIAACTWFEMLFKSTVVGNSYKPEKLSNEQAKIAQIAAHKAVQKPFKISKMK
ncbi:MAG: DUF4886 domain-containing protein [Pedobacter sp.]|nr:MAG: DUF4886 domain-containing protein [Pedobacter sp.]